MQQVKTDQNFGLVPSEFEKMVKNLKSNDEHLFEHVFLGQFSTCIKYVEMKYNAQYDDAYDATMDALLDFRLRILDGKIKYGNLRYLLNLMASQYYLRNKKSFKFQGIEENDLLSPDLIDEEDLILLKKAWKNLGNKCQSLLKMNFYSGMKLSEIAITSGKSHGGIRKQKERCLKKLSELFSNQLNQ